MPDGATKQKTLWRAQWNKRTNRFDPLDTFDGPPADPAERGPRPTAAAVGPDGTVYYVTKTQDWIVQIRNAAGDPRPQPSSATRPTGAARSRSPSAAPPPARWCTSRRRPA